LKLACNSRMVPGETFLEKFRAIARYGFEGVELRLLESDLSPETLADIEDSLSISNIRVASLVILAHGFGLPLNSQENLEFKTKGARALLELSARFHAGVFIAPEYQPQTPLPLWNGPQPMTSQDEEWLYSLLSATAEYAEKVNGFALLEPINRYETHFYHRIQEAKAVIDRVKSSRIKIVIDFFHMNLEEANIPESIYQGAGYISHVQLGDSNRLLPGRGHTDFTSGFRALRQIGYDRYMALECQIPQDPEEELPRSVRYLRGCIEDSQEPVL
jgi:sugar phosphate isomerase/epimerase